jgi:hypothetical protein
MCRKGGDECQKFSILSHVILILPSKKCENTPPIRQIMPINPIAISRKRLNDPLPMMQQWAYLVDLKQDYNWDFLEDPLEILRKYLEYVQENRNP